MVALNYINLTEISYFKLNIDESKLYQKFLNTFFIEFIFNLNNLKIQINKSIVDKYLIVNTNILLKNTKILDYILYKYIIYFIAILTLILYLNSFLKKNITNFLQMAGYLNKTTNICEKEILPIDDFFFFFFFFIFIFSAYFGTQILFSLINFNLISNLFYTLFLIKILILTIPLNLVYDYRLQIFAYIRGCTNTSNLIVEFLLDIIAVSVVFIRFLVQNVRFFFIVLSLYEIFHFLYTYNNFNIIFINNDILNTSIIKLNSNAVYVYTNFVFIYIIHIGHFIVLTTIQILIYILISFWLFYFFYTSFYLNTVESYFIKKIKVWVYI